MSDESYSQYHRQLLGDLRERILQQPPFSTEQRSENDQLFIDNLDSLCRDPFANSAEEHPGQWLLTTIVARYPHITPMVPRDLFWFFGGDCLHYLGDEEIAHFQELDEQYHALLRDAPEAADYVKLRASALSDQPRFIN